MKRKSYILLCTISFLLFSVLGHSFAQTNSTGIPFIQNYSHKVYAASESNWSVTQDARGVMYFGNSQNVLEFDGHSWKKIPIPNQQFIYSLVTGIDGKVYVGGTDDFGRLIPDNKGELVYQSFKNLLTDSLPIPRVWKVYSKSDQIYFCTLQRIYIYSIASNSIQTVTLPDDSFWSFLTNDKLYVGNYNLGLHWLNGSDLVIAKGGENFARKDIFSILPWDENTLLIATAEKGLNLLNVKTGEVSDFTFSPLAVKTNRVLLENSIYSGVVLSDSLFAFGTRLNGLYVVSKSGEIVNHFNSKLGLQSEIVTSMYFNPSMSGVLWLTLANGLASVNVTSPVRQFSAESGLNGTIYAVAKHREVLYVGTSYGVFQQVQNASSLTAFKQLDGINGEIVYSLLPFKTSRGEEMLMAGGERDVYLIRGNIATPLGFRNEVYRMLQSKLLPNRVYIATPRGVRTISYSNGNFVIDKNTFAFDNTVISNIVEDKQGNLWCVTFSGVQAVDSKGAILEIPQSVKAKTGGLALLKDEVVLSAPDNILKYNGKDAFDLFGPFNSMLTSKGKRVKEVFAVADSLAVAFFEYRNAMGVELLRLNHSGWISDSTALSIVPSMTIQTGYRNKQFIYIGGQEGLIVLNEGVQKNFAQKYKTIIRSIEIGTDSVVYKGAGGFFTQIQEQGKTISVFSNPIRYKDNNIVFTFASPYFENESRVEYRSHLEGFNRGWSPWEKVKTRNYTNLPEGKYRFFVKSRNMYGVESEEAIFEFRILPPWYRTWWAYITYVVLGLVVIRLSIAWYTRKLQEDKKRLEEIVRERTAEIVEKNKKIEHQNIAITDSIRYAKRIQTAVLPDKQTCKLFDYFIYFVPKDIVSGDFYWVHHFEKQQRLIVIAADCTGHGVPGAFMSMLGTSFLNEIVAKHDMNHSDSILNLLRKYVINTLSQGLKEGDKDERKDGMDMALASIDLNTMVLEYSGANNPLVLIRNGEIIEYKPDKMPIGAYVKQDIPFQRTEVQLQNNDVFYMFSDGYVDQFGGGDGRKYMKKKFKEFLLSIHHLPMQEQKEVIRKEMQSWMGDQEQIDDQLVIGVKAAW